MFNKLFWLPSSGKIYNFTLMRQWNSIVPENSWGTFDFPCIGQRFLNFLVSWIPWASKSSRRLLFLQLNYLTKYVSMWHSKTNSSMVLWKEWNAVAEYVCFIFNIKILIFRGRRMIGISGSLIWSKTLKELIFNPCGEFRISPEDPISLTSTLGHLGSFQIF